MESQEKNRREPEEQKSDASIEEMFVNEEWKRQAESPGILENIGRKLDETFSIKGHGLKDYIDDLKLAYEMLRDPGFTIDKSTKIILIIAFLYLVSPIDLIPDSIPFIGLLDDVLVAGYAMKNIATELERYRKCKRDSSG